jgi:outer membrane protein assembly factor BamB
VLVSSFGGPWLSILAAATVLTTLVGCGARSELEVPVPPLGAVVEDVCRAAVSGPKAMAGNCSTRDGRSRVSGPTAPHVTWTTTLATESPIQVGGSSVATDDAGSAYVVTGGDFETAIFWRVHDADGTVDWSVPLPPESSGVPIVLSQGGIDLLTRAFSDTTQKVSTFDPTSGAATVTSFDFQFLDLVPPAVGADGSLFMLHDGTGTFVAHVEPGGTVLWSSLAPGMTSSTAAIALGKDDLVVTMGQATTGVGAVVNAFEPTGGAPLWSTPLAGEPVGGPVVRSDGTVAVLINAAPTLYLVILDPESGKPTLSPVSADAFQIIGVTTDGVVIGGGDMGSGAPQLVALGSDGAVLWTHPGGGNATLTSDGAVIAFGPSTGITAIDAATGATRWQLPPPVPSACIADGALTSRGGIVALQCDGTLFGAGD